MMTESEKAEFCSETWVSIVREYLTEALSGKNLEGIQFSFCEVFTDPPAHLLEQDETKIGWYVAVANGELTVNRGLLEDADYTITCDYQTVLPLARMVFGDSPEGAAKAQKAVETATAEGKMKREGDPEAIAKYPVLAAAFTKLHDTLARRTR